MRLSFNTYINEWVAVRHGYIIIAHGSLDEVIGIAIKFILDEIKFKRLLVA
jgi:hypothetical protein